jgi:cytochrome b
MPEAAAPPPVAATVPVRVWDLPTRLFHWLLAVAVVGSIVTAEVGGNAMVWHFRLGYVVLALLAFRLLWGLCGGRWSRFASFVPTPARLLRYLGGRPAPGEHLDVGHSPLGALAVWALLVLLAVQVATGLVADDEIAFRGPLNLYVAVDTGLAATSFHEGWGRTLLIALLVLHVVAVVAYRLRGRDLLGPMLHGDKRLTAGVPASADDARSRLLAAVLAAGCAGLALWVSTLGG